MDSHQNLREANYNATVNEVIPVHEALMILRVRPDHTLETFAPGQFTMLGLGSWEPAIGDGDEITTFSHSKVMLIKRAYSIGCPLVDSQGQLVRATECYDLEFYIALVNRPGKQESMLTPRLFRLQTGDRIYCDQRVRGRYTLGDIHPDSSIVFASTGTGEAPHNAMLAELLARGHQGNIVSAVCVRKQRDLAYLKGHRELERQFTNYRYLPLTTREQINLDSSLPDFVGKRYLQDYLSTCDLERDAGWELSPDNTHIFLCGNPQMIGARKGDNPHDGQSKPGMIDVLQARGFSVESKDARGSIHYERYW